MHSLIPQLCGMDAFLWSLEEYPRKYDQRRSTTSPSHSPSSGVLRGLYFIYKRESGKVLKIQLIATPDMLNHARMHEKLGL